MVILPVVVVRFIAASPAAISSAYMVEDPVPVNCVNESECVPTVSASLFDVHTKPLSALLVPSSTKTKTPAALEEAAKSAALSHAPALQR